MQRAAAAVGAAPQSIPRGSRRPTKKQTSHEQPASCDSLVLAAVVPKRAAAAVLGPSGKYTKKQGQIRKSRIADWKQMLHRVRRHSLSLLRGRGCSACFLQSWPVTLGWGRQNCQVSAWSTQTVSRFWGWPLCCLHQIGRDCFMPLVMNDSWLYKRLAMLVHGVHHSALDRESTLRCGLLVLQHDYAIAPYTMTLPLSIKPVSYILLEWDWLGQSYTKATT